MAPADLFAQPCRYWAALLRRQLPTRGFLSAGDVQPAGVGIEVVPEIEIFELDHAAEAMTNAGIGRERT